MKKRLALIVLIFFNLSCYAQYVVTDPTHRATTIAESAKQLIALGDQLDELRLQLDELEKLHGVNDFSELFVLAGDENFWNWTPTTAELEEMAENGYGDGTKFGKRWDYYKEKYGKAWKAEDFIPEFEDSHMAHWQEDQTRSIIDSLTAGDVAFDRAEEIEKEYLKKQEEKLLTLDTQKKSQDFSNNVQLQLVRILNDIARLQAQQLKLMAVVENKTTQENEFNSRFFNTDFYKEETP